MGLLFPIVGVQWPVYNYLGQFLKWLGDTAFLYGTAGWVALQEYLPPTNVYDFVTPGIYSWASIVKNAWFTNSDVILRSGVQYYWNLLETDRRAQVTNLNGIFAEKQATQEAIMALFLAGDFRGAVELLGEVLSSV